MSMSRWGVTPPLKPPVGSGYNVLQYTVVQRLSASHAAFAGNFNKAG